MQDEREKIKKKVYSLILNKKNESKDWKSIIFILCSIFFKKIKK